MKISNSIGHPQSSYFTGQILLLFSLLTFTIVLSSSAVNINIIGVKINLVYLVFNFMVFYLPLSVSISFIIFFSFILEILAGAPPGFLVLLYMSTIPLAVWFIKKNIYIVNFMIYFSFLVVVGIIKIIMENILMYISFGEFYYYLTEVSIKEFFLNVIAALLIFILLNMFKTLFSYMNNVIIRVKEI